jgi:RNA polymerase sigma factor (sigma-70 family)
MNASEVFAANLALIDRVIAAVCHRGRLYGADAEDFASIARLALMENDYAVLRKWEGRSSLGGYLTAVLQRLLIDERVRVHGRWHQSAEAQRMGPAGVLLETLLHRDRRSLDEAFPAIRAIDPAMTRAEVEAMAGRLPARAPRPRPVDLEVVEAYAVAAERADRRAISADDEKLAQRAAGIIRHVAAALTPEERTMLELRFARSMSAPAIARAMRIPQRTLYRRIDAVLGRMRTALTSAGLGTGALGSILDADSEALDFGFAQWRTQAIGPSHEEQRPAAAEESS